MTVQVAVGCIKPCPDPADDFFASVRLLDLCASSIPCSSRSLCELDRVPLDCVKQRNQSAVTDITNRKY
jgi:hypothetical protein